MADDTRMAEDAQEVERLKRRLRKKLRQIENLELLERDLNQEELDKVRKKVEIREQLALLVQSTEEEEEKEMKRQHTESSTGSAAENEKRARQEDIGAPALSEPVTHFNETEAAVELHYDDVNPTVSRFNEAQAPDVELHYTSQETPSSGSPIVDSNLTDGWELIDGDTDSDCVRFAADAQASSSTEPRSLPSGPTVPQEPATGSTSIETTPKHSKPSKPPSRTSSSSHEGQKSKNQPKGRLEASLSEKMKKGRWKSTELNGHEDLVLDCDLDCQLGLAVTCSRDTTVKVWSLETGTLLHSLRGHTGSVTSVRLLPRFELISKADANVEENTSEWGPAAVSGSHDCSLKIWDLTSGSLISSTYTYNPITRLVLLPASQYERIGAVTGTDGGKLELFHLCGQPLSLLSERVHEEGITGLASKMISNHHGGEMVVVASGARDGVVKVHRVEEDGKRLSCLYVSEEVRSNPGVSVNPRSVSCIQISESGALFIGDHGCNLKLLDWRTNHLSKAGNHQGDIGFTDCLAGGEQQLLIASTFHIDSGDGGFNLFHDSESGLKYLGTVRPAAGPRLFCLAFSGPPGGLSVIAGGLEGVVVLWCQGAALGTTARVLRLAQGVDSASEGEDTDYDVFDAEEDDMERGEEAVNIHDNKSSGFCNCSLM